MILPRYLVALTIATLAAAAAASTTTAGTTTSDNRNLQNLLREKMEKITAQALASAKQTTSSSAPQLRSVSNLASSNPTIMYYYPTGVVDCTGNAVGAVYYSPSCIAYESAVPVSTRFNC